MDELGLGAQTLLAKHPQLVCCSISGYGSTGPYKSRPGLDQIAQGMSGFMSLTGTPEQGPTRAGLAIADLLAGMFAVQGIQLALLARARTGRGQVVDTSLLEAMLGVLTWGAGMYFETGKVPGPAGQHHPLAAPYGRFKAKDGYLNIAAPNDAIWQRLAQAIGKPEWPSDARFATAGARIKSRDALTTELEAVLATAEVNHWVTLLNDAGIPTGPVLDMQQVFSDPQVLARQMLLQMPHPTAGTFKTTGLPVKLSETPGHVQRRPPLHGEHTEEILRAHGVLDAELAELRGASVIKG
jgi:crotonobetainyl-CoA:carnitine CoA-transferase CaiB-like acyl-CoA transferase